jgi:hypothetical protein
MCALAGEALARPARRVRVRAWQALATSLNEAEADYAALEAQLKETEKAAEEAKEAFVAERKKGERVRAAPCCRRTQPPLLSLRSPHAATRLPLATPFPLSTRTHRPMHDSLSEYDVCVRCVRARQDLAKAYELAKAHEALQQVAAAEAALEEKVAAQEPAVAAQQHLHQHHQHLEHQQHQQLQQPLQQLDSEKAAEKAKLNKEFNEAAAVFGSIANIIGSSAVEQERLPLRQLR